MTLEVKITKSIKQTELRAGGGEEVTLPQDKPLKTPPRLWLSSNVILQFLVSVFTVDL